MSNRCLLHLVTHLPQPLLVFGQVTDAGRRDCHSTTKRSFRVVLFVKVSQKAIKLLYYIYLITYIIRLHIYIQYCDIDPSRRIRNRTPLMYTVLQPGDLL